MRACEFAHLWSCEFAPHFCSRLGASKHRAPSTPPWAFASRPAPQGQRLVDIHFAKGAAPSTSAAAREQRAALCPPGSERSVRLEPPAARPPAHPPARAAATLSQLQQSSAQRRRAPRSSDKQQVLPRTNPPIPPRALHRPHDADDGEKRGASLHPSPPGRGCRQASLRAPTPLGC